VIAIQNDEARVGSLSWNNNILNNGGLVEKKKLSIFIFHRCIFWWRRRNYPSSLTELKKKLSIFIDRASKRK
jgi:hypothetical protein